MKLFDDKLRSDLAPAKLTDDMYNFYDRSAVAWVSIIRDKLNNWFEKYPEDSMKELRSAFESNFSSAFYELFLHQLFVQQGFSLEPHPKLSGSSKRPDFLVTGHGIEFYLEAKEATDKSESEKSVENRENQLLDLLAKTKSPNFFFDIQSLILKSPNQPNSNRIIKYLEDKLNGIDPDLSIERYLKMGFSADIETIKYDDKDISLTIGLIPKNAENRGVGVNPIGSRQSEVTWGGADESIKSGIERKANRYGKLDKPYLVCINATSNKYAQHHDVMNALFGSVMVTYSTDPNNRNERLERAKDGVFYGPAGPQFTKVSAVLITNVHPPSMSVAPHWLINHPFAAQALDLLPFRLSYFSIDGQNLKKAEKESIGQVLDLGGDWIDMRFPDLSSQ